MVASYTQKKFAGIKNVISIFRGQFKHFLTALFILFFTDIVVSAVYSFQTHTFTFMLLINMLAQKLLTLILITVINVIETAVLRSNGFFSAYTICKYIAIEGLSIIHTLELMGISTPEIIEHLLQIL